MNAQLIMLLVALAFLTAVGWLIQTRSVEGLRATQLAHHERGNPANYPPLNRPDDDAWTMPPTASMLSGLEVFQFEAPTLDGLAGQVRAKKSEFPNHSCFVTRWEWLDALTVTASAQFAPLDVSNEIRASMTPDYRPAVFPVSQPA